MGWSHRSWCGTSRSWDRSTPQQGTYLLSHIFFTIKHFSRKQQRSKRRLKKTNKGEDCLLKDRSSLLTCCCIYVKVVL
jgi:hypothetical protein